MKGHIPISGEDAYRSACVCVGGDVSRSEGMVPKEKERKKRVHLSIPKYVRSHLHEHIHIYSCLNIS